MSASTLVFYILSFIIIGGGILAVISRKIFRAAVFLWRTGNNSSRAIAPMNLFFASSNMGTTYFHDLRS